MSYASKKNRTQVSWSNNVKVRKLFPGMTQEECGQVVGIANSTFGNLAAGRTRMTRKMCNLIADALSVSTADVRRAFPASHPDMRKGRGKRGPYGPRARKVVNGEPVIVADRGNRVDVVSVAVVPPQGTAEHTDAIYKAVSRMLDEHGYVPMLGAVCRWISASGNELIGKGESVGGCRAGGEMIGVARAIESAAKL